ncbi:hypothetical protein FQN54_009383 [Arachnomyces sp. PD_36]|nr:hypothetical protein FQN54_009383 [Arachnomyces sp. PD_36]
MEDLQIRALESGTRQGSVFGVNISFMVVIFIVIALRMYVRKSIIHAVGVDDILMVIGTVVTFVLSVGSMMAAYYGMGKHIGDIEPENFVPMLKSVYSTRILYVLAIMFVKLSLLWFYLRLDQRPYMRWTVYSLMFAVVGLSVPSFCILAFSCSPVSKFWDITGTAPGHCMDPAAQQVFYNANGILNIVTDILIYLTPMPMLWHVQISGGKKKGLFGIFGLGGFAIAAGCVRYDFVQKLSNSKDMYYLLADSINWCCIEIYTAIFCGSAPALSVLAKKLAPQIFGSSYAANRGYGGSGIPSGQHNLQNLGSRTRDGWQNTKISGHHKRGADDLASSASKESIIPSDRIVTKTEVVMEVSQHDESSSNLGASYHRRSNSSVSINGRRY